MISVDRSLTIGLYNCQSQIKSTDLITNYALIMQPGLRDEKQNGEKTDGLTKAAVVKKTT